jgi:hypothetical protein
VPWEKIRECSLDVMVMDFDNIGRNELIGRILLAGELIFHRFQLNPKKAQKPVELSRGDLIASLRLHNFALSPVVVYIIKFVIVN